MKSINHETEEFHFELSAFLSSARSVLQYANEEARTKQNGTSWYVNYVTGHSVLKFFKDKRDINIHAEPVKTHKHMEVTDYIDFQISESVHIEVTKEDGTKEVRESTDKPPKKAGKHLKTTYKESYFFTDWSGHENVIELCDKYVDELEKFIKDGCIKGILSQRLRVY